MSPSVASVNVGRPRPIDWQGRTLTTAFLKEPVQGPVRALGTSLEGDEQADRRVHGGRLKAVYAYPTEHYDFWRPILLGEALPFGSFGENLTTEGLLEDSVRIGDELRIGSTVLRVTQPRFPCVKLCARFQREDMIHRFAESLRTGFYLSIEREGVLQGGDPIEWARPLEAAETVRAAAIRKLSAQSDPG